MSKLQHYIIHFCGSILFSSPMLIWNKFNLSKTFYKLNLAYSSKLKNKFSFEKRFWTSS